MFRRRDYLANAAAGPVTHPFSAVAIVGAHNTRQAKRLEGHDSVSITVEATIEALRTAGLRPADVDMILGEHAHAVMHNLGIGPVRCGRSPEAGIAAVADAASAIATRQAEVVVVTGGRAGHQAADESTVSWTRPENEFVAVFGMFTAAEFALFARRHMAVYGTTSEQLAMVAATIRNNGHATPGALHYGRPPCTPAAVLASRLIVDPFHLLDCAVVCEGGAALVLTTDERARDLPAPPVYVHGVGMESIAPPYQIPPSWDYIPPRGTGVKAGLIGAGSARRAFAMAGLQPRDIDVCEFYDPFSFEIIRQFEAFGFCGIGEGGAFAADGNMSLDGRFPTTTDGGALAYSHTGVAQELQRVIRGVEQLTGTCASNQIGGCEVVMCSNGGSGAMYCDALILGSARP